jgi:hypothetical protein
MNWGSKKMGIAARRFFGIGVVHNSWDIVINVHWLWNEVVNMYARYEIAILCCSEWIFFHRNMLMWALYNNDPMQRHSG